MVETFTKVSLKRALWSPSFVAVTLFFGCSSDERTRQLQVVPLPEKAGQHPPLLPAQDVCPLVHNGKCLLWANLWNDLLHVHYCSQKNVTFWLSFCRSPSPESDTTRHCSAGIGRTRWGVTLLYQNVHEALVPSCFSLALCAFILHCTRSLLLCNFSIWMLVLFLLCLDLILINSDTFYSVGTNVMLFSHLKLTLNDLKTNIWSKHSNRCIMQILFNNWLHMKLNFWIYFPQVINQGLVVCATGAVLGGSYLIFKHPPKIPIIPIKEIWDRLLSLNVKALE